MGTQGTLRIGYLRETPLLVMTANHVAHDTVPYFMERFAGAYTAQLQDFVDNVRLARPAPVTIRDGMQAMRSRSRPAPARPGSRWPWRQ